MSATCHQHIPSWVPHVIQIFRQKSRCKSQIKSRRFQIEIAYIPLPIVQGFSVSMCPHRQTAQTAHVFNMHFTHVFQITPLRFGPCLWQPCSRSTHRRSPRLVQLNVASYLDAALNTPAIKSDCDARAARRITCCASHKRHVRVVYGQAVCAAKVGDGEVGWMRCHSTSTGHAVSWQRVYDESRLAGAAYRPPVSQLRPRCHSGRAASPHTGPPHPERHVAANTLQRQSSQAPAKPRPTRCSKR